MNEIAKRLSLRPLIAEYQSKRDNITDNIKAYENAVTALSTAASVQGTFGGAPLSRNGYTCDKSMLKCLRVSAWRHVYVGFDIETIFPAGDKEKFKRLLSDPPEFDMENIRGVFGKYIADPRGNILRGLAEAFCSLDKAYKSHSNVRIGVKKLPKRAIFKNTFDVWGYSYGKGKALDAINALRLYQGHGAVTWDDVKNNIDDDLDGLSFRKFKNGNLHVIFDGRTCLDINRALAEYYGEVLPDAPDPEPTKKASTAVAKDLQYYPTPASGARRLTRSLGLRAGDYVLEPQCGCGRIMDEVAKTSGVRVFGYEIDRERAEKTREKGHSVVRANFLDVPPSPEFDYVLMNPPFYGRHYLKHVFHAIAFLKPGGTLRSILPATAWYDHRELPSGGEWEDLPVGFFAESGTNVPTGIFQYAKTDGRAS